MQIQLKADKDVKDYCHGDGLEIMGQENKDSVQFESQEHQFAVSNLKTLSLSSLNSNTTTPIIQPKLIIGSPNDKYEQEADRMADYVVNQISSRQLNVKRKTTSPIIQQKRPNPQQVMQAPAFVAQKIEQKKGQGSLLPSNLQTQMEKGFGEDFSKVRVHTDKEAVQLNEQLGARAFTYGSDVYFNRGEYQPNTTNGQQLLAHELTHVVQQSDFLRLKKGANDNKEDTVTLPELTIEIPVEYIAGHAPGAGEREVEAEIAKLRGWVNLYLNAYRDGLDNFETTMDFSSDNEARPRFFDIALKEVGKILLDQLIDRATRSLPIVGTIVKGAKDVMLAFYQEAERTNSAQGEARIRDYIVAIRRAITAADGIERRLLDEMNNARPVLLQQFQNSVAISESDPSQGHVIGETALLIRNLKSEVEEFKNSIPTSREFQLMFTERFADTPGLTAPISTGGKESGSLWLHMKIYRERNSNSVWVISYEDTDSSWTLHTTAPKASRLAQSLKDSIQGDIANTSLSKYLTVKVETEVSGLNDYQDAVIYFRNPNFPQFRGHYVRLSEWVWNHTMAKRKALAISNIEEN